MLKRQLKGKSNNENSDPNEGELEEDSFAGVSKPRVLASGPSDQIEDKYNIESEVDKSKKPAEKRDLLTVKRENFLNIYKEKENVADEKEPDLMANGVRYKAPLEEDAELNTSIKPDRKPLIQDLGDLPSEE